MELAVDGNGSLIPFKIINNDTQAGGGGAKAPRRGAGTAGASGPNAGLGGQHPGVTVGGATTTLPGAGSAATTTGGGDGGGGDGGSTSAPSTGLSGASADNVLGIYGLPSDVQAKVDSIFTNTADVNQAAAIALAYIRGTDWYAQTYPGIQAGIQNGTVSNEADYRSYLNQINQLYQQYYGRSVTGDELANYLSAGRNPTYVGNTLQGQAYVQANTPEIQYLGGAFGNGRLSQDQLTALGNEQAGIDTPLGQLQQKILSRASQIQQRLFGGTLATPSLQLGANGLQSSALAGMKQPSSTGANTNIQS